MRGVLGVLSGGYAASGVVNWRRGALAAARPTRRKFAGHCRGILLVGIGGGGLVGGLGERYTRLAAAHAIHNGLADILHGTKMAYGILVQLALEGRRDELLRLDAAPYPLGLPQHLADLGIDPVREADMAVFVAHTSRPEKSIHFLSGTVDAPRLRKALEEVGVLPAD